MAPVLEPSDAKNKIEDLSGVVVKPGENPYHALIATCSDNAVSTAPSRLRSTTYDSIIPFSLLAGP